MKNDLYMTWESFSWTRLQIRWTIVALISWWISCCMYILFKLDMNNEYSPDLCFTGQRQQAASPLGYNDEKDKKIRPMVRRSLWHQRIWECVWRERYILYYYTNYSNKKYSNLIDSVKCWKLLSRGDRFLKIIAPEREHLMPPCQAIKLN